MVKGNECWNIIQNVHDSRCQKTRVMVVDMIAVREWLLVVKGSLCVLKKYFRGIVMLANMP
jgi:hypothetical protein